MNAEYEEMKASTTLVSEFFDLIPPTGENTLFSEMTETERNIINAAEMPESDVYNLIYNSESPPTFNEGVIEDMMNMLDTEPPPQTPTKSWVRVSDELYFLNVE